MPFNKKDLKGAQEAFKEKGTYENNWVSPGALSCYITGIERNEFFPYITKGVEFYCYYEDIDGEISLGVAPGPIANCMDIKELKLEERDWAPKENLLDVTWKSLIKEFDEEVMPIKSKEVLYAKKSKGRYVFWEENSDRAYLYKGIFNHKEIDGYFKKTLMEFEVGEIRKPPTKDSAGHAHSGRRNSWGIKINLPKKHERMPWKNLREEILSEFKKIVFSVDLNNI